LLIQTPFLSRGAAGRDDTDDFHPIVIDPGMGDQYQHQILDRAQSLPSFFAVFVAILPGTLERIVEYQDRILKRYAMFDQIGGGLDGVPYKPHP
jgi:hypothetical protein